MEQSYNDIVRLNSPQDIKKNHLDNFETIEFSSTLTHLCNWNCSYCSQGTNHALDDRISFKSFSLIIKKIFLEIKKTNLKKVVFSVLGGELSTDITYIEYVKEIILSAKKINIYLQIDFITNFSGDIIFFKKFSELGNLYDNMRFGLTISVHEEYYQNSKKIYQLIKKIEIVSSFNKKLLIDLKFLESNSPKYKKMKLLFDNFKLDIDKIDNCTIEMDKLLKVGSNIYGDCGLELSNQPKRYCNALVYDISIDGITDRCRNFRFNFLNFKIMPKWYLCDKACPCISMNEDYIQIPEKEFLNVQKN